MPVMVKIVNGSFALAQMVCSGSGLFYDLLQPGPIKLQFEACMPVGGKLEKLAASATDLHSLVFLWGMNKTASHTL